MDDSKTVLIDIADLRVGMFVYLDLGWMSHPFPSSSFKVANDRQLETIRALGLARVRYSPDKSDAFGAAPTEPGAPVIQPGGRTPQEQALHEQQEALRAALRRHRLQAQQSSFAQCEEKFAHATSACAQVMACVGTQPGVAREKSQTLIGGMVGEMMADGESMIHLLSDGSGDRAATSACNAKLPGGADRKSTRLNSSHRNLSRMPSSA